MPKTLALLALLLSVGSSAIAETTPSSPPWLLQSGNFFMMVFKPKAEAVKKLLPKGVEALADKDGLVTATFEMYETRRASGLPSYKTAFLVVDVKGHDSREGMPGHFAVWGRVSPQESLNAFVSHFGFPYEHADITLALEEAVHVGTVSASGKKLLTARIAPNAEQPVTAEGSVNMVGRHAERGVVRSTVPYLSNGHVGKVIAFELEPNADPALELIDDLTPVWSLVTRDQTFSYSAAVSDR
jgi:hypothetical protein